MPHLPARYRTRLGYAVTCALLGALFAVIYFVGLALLVGDGDMKLGQFVVFPIASLGAFPAAWICWPRSAPRGRGRMAVAGVLTVFVAFVFLAIAMPLTALFTETSSGAESLSDLILITISSAAIILIFGSILTLGIPYLIGALAAMLFADPKPDP